MALISHSIATHSLGDKINFDRLSHLETATKEQVATSLALAQLETVKKSQLGWGYTIKRLLATTSTYASILASPFIALISALWFYSDRIRQIDPFTMAASGSAAGAIFAADYALGRLIGIRPITACLIALYDMHRFGAKKVSNKVEESYKTHEQEMKEVSKKARTKLVEELKSTYLGVATQVKYQSRADQQLLLTQLPKIRTGLSSLGLTMPEIIEILSPLEGALRIHQAAAAAKPAAAPSPIAPAPQGPNKAGQAPGTARNSLKMPLLQGRS